MNKFNLEEYEPVEERLEKFHAQYKEGRVITEMVGYTDDRVVFKASLFRSFDEEKPWATGYAEETRGEGGYVNNTSHLENCETSAIGRALANAGYAPTGKRPSREEMTKVDRQYRDIVRRGLKEKVSDDQLDIESLKEIKRLYAVTSKLYPNAQNIGQHISKLVKTKGFDSISKVPANIIKDLADKLEVRLKGPKQAISLGI